MEIDIPVKNLKQIRDISILKKLHGKVEIDSQDVDFTVRARDYRVANFKGEIKEYRVVSKVVRVYRDEKKDDYVEFHYTDKNNWEWKNFKAGHGGHVYLVENGKESEY